MLVLTRRPSDRILFPKLGIAVHVVRVDGRSVRLGIEAPRDVHIVRHELADDGRYQPPAESPQHELNHRARNQLHTALLSLQVLARQLELGHVAPEDIEHQIADTIHQLEAMEFGLEWAAKPAALTADSPTADPIQPAAVRRRTALLVDDNANERSLLAGFLKTYAYDVATANDGATALDYLTSHAKPDVVLLDMNMPRLGGAATIHVIRSNPKLADVKVFAVSGLAPRQANVPVGPDGVDRWFTKPISPDVLVKEMDRELTAYRAAESE